MQDGHGLYFVASKLYARQINQPEYCITLFQIPSWSCLLNTNDAKKYIPFNGELKSAVLSPDWLSTEIKVHVPILGDSGVKSRFFTLEVLFSCTPCVCCGVGCH